MSAKRKVIPRKEFKSKHEELLSVEKRIAQYEEDAKLYTLNEKIVIMTRTKLFLARKRQIELIKEVYKF